MRFFSLYFCSLGKKNVIYDISNGRSDITEYQYYDSLEVESLISNFKLKK